MSHQGQLPGDTQSQFGDVRGGLDGGGAPLAGSGVQDRLIQQILVGRDFVGFERDDTSDGFVVIGIGLLQVQVGNLGCIDAAPQGIVFIRLEFLP